MMETHITQIVKKVMLAVWIVVSIKQSSVLILLKLSSIGEGELSSMAAGLAFMTPDDAPSVADSALGRSTVITATTTRMTQFSKVSLIMTIVLERLDACVLVF